MKRRFQSQLLYLALGIMQAAHSTEEYLTSFHNWIGIVSSQVSSITGFFPVIRMSERMFVVVNFALITCLLSMSPFVFQNNTWATNVAKLIAVSEIVNGCAHLSAAIYVGGYQPGSISAIGLIILGILLVRSLWTEQATREQKIG